MMKKTLLVLLGGVALASVVATVDAGSCRRKKHCKEERVETVCKQECPTECDPCKTPAPEVHGVLCKAVRGFEYIPQDDKCCEEFIPCPPKRCVRLVEQPDKIEIEWVKKEICVPQPPIEEVYYEDQPDKCCTKKVPCAPKCVPCIRYQPMKIEIDPGCVRAASCDEISTEAPEMN